MPLRATCHALAAVLEVRDNKCLTPEASVARLLQLVLVCAAASLIAFVTSPSADVCVCERERASERASGREREREVMGEKEGERKKGLEGTRWEEGRRWMGKRQPRRACGEQEGPIL
jgi:hypothetical protein